MRTLVMLVSLLLSSLSLAAAGIDDGIEGQSFVYDDTCYKVEINTENSIPLVAKPILQNTCHESLRVMTRLGDGANQRNSDGTITMGTDTVLVQDQSNDTYVVLIKKVPIPLLQNKAKNIPSI